MAVDPICGMTVDEASALHVERDGQTFYFCSEHCRQKFLSAPANAKDEHMAHAFSQHTAAHEHAQPSMTRPTAKYFCPMCPGVESNESGVCPKCGMALERN